MASRSRNAEDHMFSIELKSKDYVKSLALQNDDSCTVLIEGFLGKLENLNFTEDVMLEINGANGSLKMDLTRKEMKKLLPKRKPMNKKIAKDSKKCVAGEVKKELRKHQ